MYSRTAYDGLLTHQHMDARLYGILSHLAKGVDIYVLHPVPT